MGETNFEKASDTEATVLEALMAWPAMPAMAGNAEGLDDREPGLRTYSDNPKTHARTRPWPSEPQRATVTTGHGDRWHTALKTEERLQSAFNATSRKHQISSQTEDAQLPRTPSPAPTQVKTNLHLQLARPVTHVSRSRGLYPKTLHQYHEDKCWANWLLEF